MFLKKIDDPQSLQFSIDCFNGPLDLLIHLIQKEELQLSKIPLSQITQQYQHLSPTLEASSEFIAQAAYLLWLKSKSLLPVSLDSESEEEVDPQWDVIHHLIDYCRFKEVTKELIAREEFQSDVFARGALEGDVPKKPFGIEHVSLEELAGLFQKIMHKTAQRCGTVEEEVYQVAEWIQEFRGRLKKEDSLSFALLFNPERSRQELIVMFLAILELMKMGEILVARNSGSQDIYILSNMKQL